MTRLGLLPAAGVLAASVPAAAQTLTPVASFDHQVTGVAVTADGRRFVNFPRWTEDAPISVAEVAKDGSLRSYPDARWNSWRNARANELPVADYFVCVQSVVPDGQCNRAPAKPRRRTWRREAGLAGVARCDRAIAGCGGVGLPRSRHYLLRMATSMNSITLDARASARPLAIAAKVQDDKAMLRAAAELTRDLVAPKPSLYWADMLASAVIGYAALVGAVVLPGFWAVAAAVVAVLALYRAMSFIHEVSHMKHSGAMRGFRHGWDAIVGVPMLIPSFMYEGVHNLHHAKTRYGTAEDPEYLPLALMKPWTLPVFVLVSALAPLGLLIRYGVLAPLSVLVPGLRRAVVERYSALAINPQFRRRAPEGEAKLYWNRVEVAASLWAVSLIVLVATGVLPLRAFLIGFAIASAVAVLNQVRTLVAHLWENDGEPMSVTAQYLDSVNVPPPTMLPMLWAPVGLRYHALHHLLPGLPYHSLGEAHRRLSAALEEGSPFHKASYTGLPYLAAKIARSTMGQRH